MRYAYDTYEQGNPIIEDDEPEPSGKREEQPQANTYDVDEEIEDMFP